MRGLFITGTDTGVGKTFIGQSLVQKLYQSGIDVQPRKPVESGCVNNNDQLIPEDGLAYHEATDKTVALDTITPLRFQAAVAPPRAAQLENKTLSLAQLEFATQQNLTSDSFCIVEGAGGFYSPIAEDGLNADLAKALNLPVLLIAADRLGCINHVLLTLEAIKSAQLECQAIVMNKADESPYDPGMDNIAALKKLVSAPIFQSNYNHFIDSTPFIELVIRS
jgi:dethiobiotin synthetase